MRLIGEIKNETHAQRFASHLLTEGISAKVEPEGQQFEIWVKDEDQLGRAAEELEAFLASPDSSKYQTAIENARQLKRIQDEKRRRVEKNIVHVSQKQGRGQSRPLTILLIVICGVIAILTNFGSPTNFQNSTFRAMMFVSLNEQQSSELIANGAGMDKWQTELASIKKGQIWRLITPMFVHFGTIHLIFNMIWLFQLGQLIENRYGTVYFAILVVVTAIAANVGQQLAPAEWGGSQVGLVGPYLMSLFGGMSGVVYGLLGFAWIKSTLDPNAGFRLRESAILIMVIWLFFCMSPLAQMFFGEDFRVANWAHAVGLVAGLAFAYLPLLMRK